MNTCKFTKIFDRFLFSTYQKLKVQKFDVRYKSHCVTTTAIGLAYQKLYLQIPKV